MNTINKTLILFASLFVAFALLMCLAMSMPINKDNIERSAQTLEAEGLYPISFCNNYSSLSFLLRDQYTDCLMLNEAVAGEGIGAVEAAILTPCLKSGRGVDMMPDDLRQVANGTMAPNVNYDWYWHGYLVALKPLLFFFDYGQIRIINCILMLGLMCITLLLVKKRMGWHYALLSIGVLLMMHYETVPFTMQYVSVFFVTFGACALLLAKPEIWARDNNDYLFFFAVGGITVFVDFLTTPVVSLGIPLLFWLMIKKDDHNKVISVISLSLMWGFGYASLWASKWGLCALTFDPSVIENAMSHADKWGGNDQEVGRIAMTIAIIKKYIALIWSMNWGWIVVATIAAIIVLPKRQAWLKENLWILLIALMPIAWSCILVNHNNAHFGFTWRLISISLFAIAFGVVKSIDWSKIRRHG